jgi:hypothetical protein
MVITKKYAQKLIRQGKARTIPLLDHCVGRIVSGTCIDNGVEYVIVERLDIQRVDHYPID